MPFTGRVVRFLSGLVLGAALWSVPSGQTGAQEPPPAPPDNRVFTLAPRFVKNQVSRYQTGTDLTMKFVSKDPTKADVNLAASLNTNIKYIVKETRADGATVAVIVEGGSLLDVSDQPVKLPVEKDDYPRTATFDKFGRLLSLKDTGKKADSGSPLASLLDQSNLLIKLHFVPLPEQPVKIGDSWTARYPLVEKKDKKEPEKTAEKPADEDDTENIVVKATLLGTEKQGELEALKIKHIVTIPFEALTTAEGKATTDKSKATGKIVTRMVFTQTVFVLPDTGQVLQGEGTVEGKVQFSGTIAQQVPNDTMLITGKFALLKIAGAVKK